MGKNEQAVTRGTKAFSAITWFLFVAGSAAFGWMLWSWGPPARVLSEGGLDLPVPSVWLVSLSEQLRSILGVSIAAGAVVLLSVPFFRGARGKRGARFYGVLAFAMLFGAAACWWFLARPVGVAQLHLG